MGVYLKSFQISNIIYDAGLQKLTFEYVANGVHARRVNLGARTDEDIVRDFKQILNQYYADESVLESE